MKSKKRLDEEISAVAKIWNSADFNDPRSEFNQLASAIYGTLKWARGLRELPPSARLIRKLKSASAPERKG